MANPASRPRLRPVEVVVVPDPRFGRALLLRDSQGIAKQAACLPVESSAIVMRFSGRRTCAEIAALAASELERDVPVQEVVEIASALEESLHVHGPAFDRAMADAVTAFADAPVREASHAGSAYHRDPHELARYLDVECLRPAASAFRSSLVPAGRLLGLIAPHIDPWRGARSYGEAYDTLARTLDAGTKTFILFGTSHAPMRSPFALCRKSFATPLGEIRAHDDAIDRIAAACDFDPFEDQLNHKREHSLEFQAVFLRHLFGAAGARRGIRIVPILAGLGESELRGHAPSRKRSFESFFDAVRRVVEDERAVVIAGADLAHVGPRFGDPTAYKRAERRALRDADRASLAYASECDADGFFRHVVRDLDKRRVCGLAPVYALLKTLDPRARGTLRYYEQTIDPDEGSIVSHAAMGFSR